MNKQIATSTVVTLLALLLLGVYSCKKKSTELDFTYSGTLHAGYLVSFHSQADNAGSYLWNFGDGSRSTDPNPNHTYNSASSFVVTLMINGDTAKMVAKILTIEPSFDFTVSGVTAAGSPVTFTSNAPSGSSFSWDLGDGSRSTESAPSHTFSSNGTYDVSLILNNDSAHIIKKTISIFANAIYVSAIAGTRTMHHTYTSAYPWYPYHTTDTLADVTMTINLISPYVVTIGTDTLTYQSSSFGTAIRFTHYDMYKNINNSVSIEPATSAIDYILSHHISAGAGDANDHYYNY